MEQRPWWWSSLMSTNKIQDRLLDSPQSADLHLQKIFNNSNFDAAFFEILGWADLGVVF